MPGCVSSLLLGLVYLPWRRHLAAQEGVEPQLHADNLKCVSRDPGVPSGQKIAKLIIFELMLAIS